MNNQPFNRRKFLQTARSGALLASSAALFTLPARALAGASPANGEQPEEGPAIAKLITLDPAHFHAAVLQERMLPGVDRRVSVYAPLGPGLLTHLQIIEQFNTRADHPTRWELDIHCSPRPLEEMLAARPGNVVVMAGHNAGKIGKIKASLEAGLNVLVDKPWIIDARDFPALESALALADQKGLIAYDLMTERYEITRIIQRALVNDPEVFGQVVPADPERPAVFMENVHTILNTVNGVPSLRPPFFFDIHDQGMGLTDVGTHLVDLVQWTLFPNQAISYQDDIKVQRGKCWSTPITAEQFRQVTGAAAFPSALAPYVQGGRLDYQCNNQVDYTLRGVQVRLKTVWVWEPRAGDDPPQAFFRGTKARVELRENAGEHHRPEVFVVPNDPGQSAALTAAVRRRMASLAASYPGIGVEATGSDVHILIPDGLRQGLGAHLAQVAAEFLTYLRSPQSLPAWERPNMLAKYYVTTTGVQLGHKG